MMTQDSWRANIAQNVLMIQQCRVCTSGWEKKSPGSLSRKEAREKDDFFWIDITFKHHIINIQYTAWNHMIIIISFLGKDFIKSSKIWNTEHYWARIPFVTWIGCILYCPWTHHNTDHLNSVLNLSSVWSHFKTSSIKHTSHHCTCLGEKYKVIQA